MPKHADLCDEASNDADEVSHPVTKVYSLDSTSHSIRMLAASLEDASKKDLVDMLFARDDSRSAARAFLSWLREKRGRCTSQEMSRFADELQSGRRGCRLSRVNFYGTVLRRFVDLGLVTKDLSYDSGSRRALKAYRIVVQPVGRHRPISPSLMYLAHVISERWNGEFIST